MQWQLQSYICLLVLIETTCEIIRLDHNFSIDLQPLIPHIQDTLIQAYRYLSNPQLQEQALMRIASMARQLALHLKGSA